MNVDFDVIIVGSGPAGVSAAFPLLKAGLKVLMVDGGRVPEVAPPELPFLRARIRDNAQSKWMIGQNFHALRQLDAVSPKLRVPTHAYVFDGFNSANHIQPQEFIAVGSLATGGLSNSWGCGVARWSVAELSGFPFDAAILSRSYETVARRIGVSGGQNDDLSDYFGLDAWSQPPIQLDTLHTSVLQRYDRRRADFAALGFRLGRSRVAALSADYAGRQGCDLSGNCLYGCHRRALYSAADELPQLLSYSNFHHHPGFIVENVASSDAQVSLSGRYGGEFRGIRATKVLLAAGTLATTGLALRALNLARSVTLRSCPTAAFLLWLPGFLGAARVQAFGLGQLSFSLAMEPGIAAFGSTFGTTGIPLSEFTSHLPLKRRYGIDVLRSLLSSCSVGNVFLPGHLSAAKATLGTDGALRIDGGYRDEVTDLMATAEKRLRKVYWKLGAILLPMSFTVGRPGGDIHYAGTLPMRPTPVIGESDPFGELCGLADVHVIDGACLSSLSEKSHTLTIMANADRIGNATVTRLLERRKC